MKGKQTTTHSSRSHVISDVAKIQSQSGSSASSKPRQAPSVPISVYRDLAQELKAAKHQLLTLTSENQALRHQNQSLRQEVTQVIASVTALQRMLQAMDGEASTPPHPIVQSSPNTIAQPQSPSTSGYQVSQNGVTDELIAELDRTLSAQIAAPKRSAPNQDRGTSEAIASGPFCEVDPIRLAQALEAKAIANKTIADKVVSTPVISDQMSEDAAAQFFSEQPVDAPDAMDPAQHESQAKPVSKIWLTLTLLVVVVSAFSAGFLIMLPFLNRDVPPTDAGTSTSLILPRG